ncbi:MAG: hypothetical protein KBB09_02305 [Firmicutes bacterium]|nr:hypothetical protein [Bacillota bacterium]
MGRGGGGGGGGRSSGGSFGGSRSSGGRSGGSFSSSRSGSSFGSSSSGSRGSSSGSSFSGRGGTGGGLGRGVFLGGPRMNPSGTTGTGTRPGGASQNSGCSKSLLFIFISVLILVVFAIVVIAVINSSGAFSLGPGVTKSTWAREPLPPGSVRETRYYTDEVGWIANETELLEGMRYFYKKTGVQPYLYITDNIDGDRSPTEAVMDMFANALYDILFDDEAHLLLVFFEYNDSYMSWYVAGSQAKTVVDQEGADILLDYIDRNYYSDLSDEEFFSKSFADAADRMMTVTRSPWIPVFIVLGIGVALIVGFIWWRNAKAQKNLEAKQTEEILKTPIEQFGDKEAEDLAKKYQEEKASAAVGPHDAEMRPAGPLDPLGKFGDKEAEELAEKYEEGFRRIEPEAEEETFSERLSRMSDDEVEELARKYTEEDEDRNQG